MRRLFLIAFAAAALGACSGKKEVVENGSAAENLSFESTPANDASALEAVEAQDSRAAIPAGNEAEPDNSAEANADSNVAENTANNSN